MGPGLYVVAEAIIFLPMLYVAAYLSPSEVIPTAAFIILLLFAGLTYTAFSTRTDFSFLWTALSVEFFAGLGLIVASIRFGFSLGLIFSLVMVVLAAGAILYNTSSIIHHHQTDQCVAASLALFASAALLFRYSLRILSRR